MRLGRRKGRVIMTVAPVVTRITDMICVVYHSQTSLELIYYKGRALQEHSHGVYVQHEVLLLFNSEQW